MKSKLILFIAIIGLIGIFSSCEKDGSEVVMVSNPAGPQLTTVPNLALERSKGQDMLTFVVTPVNPGFEASATYFLEAAAAGTSFADPVLIMTSSLPTGLKISVSDLNAALLKKFTADQTASVDFRVRSVLIVDAGTGAKGTASNPLQYVSDIVTVNAKPYGLPKLVLQNSGLDQIIESSLGNGVYTGYVKLDPTKPFTLQDPDANKVYGGAGGNLNQSTNGIVADASGWHILTVDVNTMKYTIAPYMIGLVGSATPNQWDAPDQKMDYNRTTGTWSITLDLVAGEIKFRKNDGWAWNLGGTPDALVHNGANIAVPAAGNYTVTLTIISDAGELGTFTIVKNN